MAEVVGPLTCRRTSLRRCCIEWETCGFSEHVALECFEQRIDGLSVDAPLSLALAFQIEDMRAGTANGAEMISVGVANAAFTPNSTPPVKVLAALRSS